MFHSFENSIIVKGHYSHIAELPNGIIYISGQKAWDPATGILIDGDIEKQTNQIFDNIYILLSQLNLDFKNITRMSCYLTNIEYYELFNKVYSKRLSSFKPTRSVIEIKALRDNALVEIVADAFRY